MVEPPTNALRAYLSASDAASGESSIPFADQLRRVMPAAARVRAKRYATAAVSHRARRVATAAASSGRLRLHLGCGSNYLTDWLNIDLVGAPTDLNWDILRPLPFPDGSADAVFLEHVFEHLTYAEVLTVLSDLRRVLAPGGVLRVGVPDAGLYARSYATDRSRLEQLRRGRPTAMLALHEVFQQHGHVSAYDGEMLVALLEAAGFPDAKETPGGTSRLLEQAPDKADRIPETVYVEVVRPA